jgi:hypothetical protein
VFERGTDGAWKPLSTQQAAVKTERIGTEAGGGTTWYRFSLDRNLLPAKSGALALAVRANDDDFGGLKQFTQTPAADLDAAQPNNHTLVADRIEVKAREKKSPMRVLASGFRSLRHLHAVLRVSLCSSAPEPLPLTAPSTSLRCGLSTLFV